MLKQVKTEEELINFLQALISQKWTVVLLFALNIIIIASGCPAQKNAHMKKKIITKFGPGVSFL